MPSAKKKGRGNAAASKSKRSSTSRKQAPAGGGRKKVSKGASFADTGASLGSSLGGMLGRMGAGLISKITGFGSYQVSKNTVANGNAVASFYNDGDGVVVCHREYLTDVSGSTGFTLASYAVNPGLVSSFPWLSSVAHQFEEYEMLGLVYEFRPLSGMAVSTSSASLGCVIYATDYNPYNPLFPNKQSMESYEFSTSTVPFNEMLHPVECKPGSDVLRKKFVRSGPVAPGTLQLYDVGNFQVATQGMQSSYTAGELWVSYHVRFSKPRLDLTPVTGSARFSSGPFDTGSNLNPQGTAGWITSYSTLPGVLIPVAPGVPGRGFTLQATGYYFVVICVSNTFAGVTSPPSITFGSNIVATPNLFPQGISPATAFQGVNSSSVGMLLYYLQAVSSGTDAANFVTILGGGTVADAVVQVNITALPYAPPGNLPL